MKSNCEFPTDVYHQFQKLKNRQGMLEWPGKGLKRKNGLAKYMHACKTSRLFIADFVDKIVKFATLTLFYISQ